MASKLNPDKALIFRIVHRDNVPWILDHGLHCRSSPTLDPHFRIIGNTDLIDKRKNHNVPIPPGGTLSEYVPFYFTPYSMMMLNIRTGYNGVTKVPNEEIVIFVSSVHKLAELKIPFVFTDRHALLAFANYSSSVADLNQIDWKILSDRDFKTDPSDPGKKERYQAEALVHRHLPVEALLGVGCYNSATDAILKAAITQRRLNLQVKIVQDWYF